MCSRFWPGCSFPVFSVSTRPKPAVWLLPVLPGRPWSTDTEALCIWAGISFVSHLASLVYSLSHTQFDPLGLVNFRAAVTLCVNFYSTLLALPWLRIWFKCHLCLFTCQNPSGMDERLLIVSTTLKTIMLAKALITMWGQSITDTQTVIKTD